MVCGGGGGGCWGVLGGGGGKGFVMVMEKGVKGVCDGDGREGFLVA